jgi:serine/alanine adding enzyme
MFNVSNLPDIYFSPEWGKLYCQLDNGNFEYYYYESEYGQIYYPFVKRPVDYKFNEIQYYDTVTPYGFNGPIILGCENGRKKILLDSFNDIFTQYCFDNHIVAEYVRFCPWLKNHIDFADYYKIKPNRTVIGIDLSVKDVLYDEINGTRRNKIRNAIRFGVSVEYDFRGDTLDDFLKLYEYTIEKNKISDYYKLTKPFLIDNFIKLKNNIFIANGILEGKCISSSIFLFGKEYLHYHFSANNPNYDKYNANSLLLYDVSQWGIKNQNKMFLLGGGGGSFGLTQFKESFTKNNIFDFFVGEKIRDPQSYDAILKIKGSKNENYFPAYRE